MSWQRQWCPCGAREGTGGGFIQGPFFGRFIPTKHPNEGPILQAVLALSFGCGVHGVEGSQSNSHQPKRTPNLQKPATVCGGQFLDADPGAASLFERSRWRRVYGTGFWAHRIWGLEVRDAQGTRSRFLLLVVACGSGKSGRVLGSAWGSEVMNSLGLHGFVGHLSLNLQIVPSEGAWEVATFSR